VFLNFQHPIFFTDVWENMIKAKRRFSFNLFNNYCSFRIFWF